MRLSLSTNWCNQRLESGEEIADLALALGFEEIELGYRTTPQQAAGFRRRLDVLPVGSVHAFCPVPISAPDGNPELYALAAFDPEARKMAQLQIKRTVAFASSMGADTVVLHAGGVPCNTWFARNRMKARTKRGRAMLDIFMAELEALVPYLERHHIVLALENLPYLEGFPNEAETAALLAAFPNAPVRAWFDTGHHRVRECNKWLPPDFSPLNPTANHEPQNTSHEPRATNHASRATSHTPPYYQGMHLNDVIDRNDDHLAPGCGKVDFAALRPLAESVRHRVFEPNPSVTETALRKGLAYIRSIWE